MTPFTNHNTSPKKSFLAKTVDTAVHTTKLAVVASAMVVAQIKENHDQDSKEMQESTGSPGAVATAKA